MRNNLDKTQDIQKRKLIGSSMELNYIQWLKDPKKCIKFEKPQHTLGRNFISEKGYPYPSNPAFVPPIPLSLDVRKEIGQKWKQGKNIREISEMFGISFIRVEAILRLLELESKWSRDGKILESYAQSMHHMLGSTTNRTLSESQFFISTPSDTQTFTIIPENSEFTHIDASNQLQREPYSNIKEKLIRFQLDNSQYSEYKLSLNKKLQVQNEEILESNSKKSRFNLKVIDSRTGDIWIRSKEGILSPIIFLLVPPIRKKLGYIPPEPIPKNYPLPKRKREILQGYDD
ncbi:hypothetical protein PCANB_000622 [Pneumocystis canis]|nr:hypothetical protein PCANB_000622 [Pneumocystis canis]